MSDLVVCSLCGKIVPAGETCQTLACRACHKTEPFEVCLARDRAQMERVEREHQEWLKDMGLKEVDGQYVRDDSRRT